MSGNGIPVDEAELLSTLLEGFLYGFSLLMFGGTIWTLWSRRHIGQLSHKLLAVACLLLLLSTTHFIIDIIRVVEGFILYRDTYPGGPIAFFSDPSQWTFVSKNIVYTIQSLIGDGVIIYRCHAVWPSKLVVILPALLWCGAAVTGFQAVAKAARTSFFEYQIIVPWVKAFYAMSFSTNLLSTLLLAYRIWHLDQKSLQVLIRSRSPLRHILHIVVDAGVIYNLTIVAIWICLSRESNGQFVILDMIVPIISISFYMVIIRVGLLPLDHSMPSFFKSSENEVRIRITVSTEDKIGDGTTLGH